MTKAPTRSLSFRAKIPQSAYIDGPYLPPTSLKNIRYLTYLRSLIIPFDKEPTSIVQMRPRILLSAFIAHQVYAYTIVSQISDGQPQVPQVAESTLAIDSLAGGGGSQTLDLVTTLVNPPAESGAPSSSRHLVSEISDHQPQAPAPSSAPAQETGDAPASETSKAEAPATSEAAAPGTGGAPDSAPAPTSSSAHSRGSGSESQAPETNPTTSVAVSQNGGGSIQPFTSGFTALVGVCMLAAIML